MALKDLIAKTHHVTFGLAYKPDPSLTVSEHADEYCYLPKGTPEPGKWRTLRTPYLKEIMDSLSPSCRTQEVVFMKPTRVGGTSAGNCWLTFVVHLCPGPFMLVLPDEGLAALHSKQQLAGIIKATPVMRDRIKGARERDGGNTTLAKEFPGGIVTLCGAQSGAAFRDKDVRYLHLADVDGYPHDVDKEGDPIGLARNRTDAFGEQKKIYIESTPTRKGFSQIETEYENSDRRKYHVPCPHCGHKQVLLWEGIVFEHDKYNLVGDVKYRCKACGVLIEEYYKAWWYEVQDRCEWIATNPGHIRRGYHISSLYSPLGWLSWADIVREFLEAKKNNDPVKFKKFWSTRMAEPYEEKGDEVSAETLKARLEAYKAEVPHGVGVLIASVDVQHDRLECHVVGYGAQEESWLIAFSQFNGNPEREQVWFEIDKFLQQEFEHESGAKMKIEACGIDSGFMADQVYRFCKAREYRRVWTLKGDNGEGNVVRRTQNKNRYNARLFIVGTHAAKDIIIARLGIKTPSPGYIHLPNWVDDEYLAQLTAEKALRRYVKGKGTIREYVKIRERNEALDLTVYALATLYILGPAFVKELGKRASEIGIKKEAAIKISEQKETDITPQTQVQRAQPRVNSYVNSWRD